ncbi:MAG: hypothetical protein ABI588_05215 [Arenimonas sp.]
MDLNDLIDQLPTQAANLDRGLLDPRMPRGAKPALSLSLERDWRGSLDGREWRVRTELAGAATVSVFANEADEDVEHIFGVGPKQPTAARAPALLAPGVGRAWLKIAVAGELGAQASRSAGPGRIALAGRGRLVLGAYLRVQPQLTLRGALESRRDAAAFVLDAESVRKLGIDDASYASLGGTLSARVEVDWADVLSTPITALAGCLPEDRPLMLSVDARASVSAEVELEDGFCLVFTGLDADRVGVSLQRSASASFELRAQARASVRLANPDLPRELLADVVAQLLGVAPAQLSKLRTELAQLLNALDDATGLLRLALAKAGVRLDAAIDAAGLPLARRRLAQLQALAALAAIADPGSRAAALGLPLAQVAEVASHLDALGAELAARFGTRLDALLAKLQLPSLPRQPAHALRGLLEHLEHVESGLVAAASKRIEAGLDFEYHRVASNEALFSAVLGRAHPDFAALHGALLGLDLASALEASRRSGSGIALETFLHQKTVKRSVSLGLDLGGFYSDRDNVAREWTETLRVLPDAAAPAGQRRGRQVALHGSRTRVETAFGSRGLWRGDFAADFQSVDAGGNLGRWRFTLALGFRSATPAASEAWLLGAADYAALWGVVSEQQVESLATRLRESGAPGKLANIELSLRIAPGAFEHDGFLRGFGSVDEAQMCEALATALQRIEGFPERCDIGRRRQAYRGAIEVLLGSSGVDLRDADAVAAFVARGLANASAGLRSFEAQHAPPSPGSVADISRRTGSLLGLFREFRQVSALERFRTAASPGGGADRKSIEKSLAGWDLAWRDRYPLRWQVALLRQLAASTGVPAAALQARLKLVVEGKHAFVFGSA